MTETGDNASDLQADIAKLEADLRPEVPVTEETENAEAEPVSPATDHVHLPG